MTYSVQPEVDLAHLVGPARDQGSRGLCLAYSSSDLHLSGRTDLEPLSAEYVANKCHAKGVQIENGLTTEAVMQVLRFEGQPVVSKLPDAPDIHPYNPLANGNPPFTPMYYCSLQERSSQLLDFIIQGIKQGRCSVIGARITDLFFTPGINLITTGGTEVGRHAMVCCGIGRDRKGNTVIKIKNSWGENWGINGFAWLDENFIRNNVELALFLEGIKDEAYS